MGLWYLSSRIDPHVFGMIAIGCPRRAGPWSSGPGGSRPMGAVLVARPDGSVGHTTDPSGKKQPLPDRTEADETGRLACAFPDRSDVAEPARTGVTALENR